MFGWGKIFHLQERCCNGHCGMTFCCYLWVHPGSAGWGGILRLLAILSYSLSLSTSTFAMMTFQTFNWVHLQIRCPSLIRFDLLQTFFWYGQSEGVPRFLGVQRAALNRIIICFYLHKVIILQSNPLHFLLIIFLLLLQSLVSDLCDLNWSKLEAKWNMNQLLLFARSTGLEPIGLYAPVFHGTHLGYYKITCKGLGVCFNPGKSAC